MTLDAALFYALAAIILVSAAMVVTVANPIYSALFLASSMVGVGLLFFEMGAHFLGGVQLIVYAGAVVVLVVMVLMLFDLREEKRAFSKGPKAVFFTLLGGGWLCGLIMGVVKMSSGLLPASQNEAATTPASTTRDLGFLLFTKYLFAFEVLGLLLLFIAIGVVAVSRAKGGTHERV